MKAYLTREYRFVASHRLHVEGLSEAENQAAYGKCNNPFGHGHNYSVQVTYSGDIDPVTGMVCDLGALDAFACTRVLEIFDHSNLNTLVPFKDLVPTSENVTYILQSIFTRFDGAKLETIHVRETPNNSFDLGEIVQASRSREI